MEFAYDAVPRITTFRKQPMEATNDESIQGEDEDRVRRDSWRGTARVIAAGANTCLVAFPVTPII